MMEKVQPQNWWLHNGTSGSRFYEGKWPNCIGFVTVLSLIRTGFQREKFHNLYYLPSTLPLKIVPMLFLNWAPPHESVLGSGSIAPHILYLGPRWRWVVSFTLRPLYLQGKSPWYPLDRRLGGPQSQFGHGGEEKIPSLYRDSNPR
jgi:hypothetical protein